MLLQYIKQSLQILRENRLVSIVSILGTALAIALVMVMFMVYQIKTANYAPETARDRTLYGSVASRPKPGMTGQSNNTGFSYPLIKNWLYDLKTPAVVAAFYSGGESLLAIPAKQLYADYRVKWTDEYFWKAYQFRFLEGRPFTSDEINAGVPKAIISEEVARQLFHGEKAIGQIVDIDLKPHEIVGVVADVSRATGYAYAQVWATLTSNADAIASWNEDTVGSLMLVLQAHSKKDLPEMQEELDNVLKRCSDNNLQYQIEASTYSAIDWIVGVSSGKYYLQNLLIILFLLLLPALNLTGITMNNIRKRSSEVGIRKAFGATGNILMGQILIENLVITAIGALIGFLLSFFFVYISRSFLLTADTMLTMGMLFQPANFVAAVVFCLVMNLLSAGVPAWRMSRQPIVYSLTGKTI